MVALLGANLLMNVAHGPLYAFYSIYLDGAGYSKTLIGALWSLGVVAEIAVFLTAPWWMRRFGAYHVLLACFALAVVAVRPDRLGRGQPRTARRSRSSRTPRRSAPATWRRWR